MNVELNVTLGAKQHAALCFEFSTLPRSNVKNALREVNDAGVDTKLPLHAQGVGVTCALILRVLQDTFPVTVTKLLLLLRQQDQQV